jgi:NIPSNAP protein
MTFAREQTAIASSFGVVELRRYTIKDGERENFSRYFESYFPEAFQQTGAVIFGQFLERENRSHFTWIRGFSDMDARAKVNAEFYYGPDGRSIATP